MRIKMSFSSVLCIGGCVVDRIGETAEAMARPHTSNIGRMRSGFGGVARNVAENLARLGVPVRLVSRIGRDADGQALVSTTAAAGVDVSGIETDPGLDTASYTAIFNGEGELVIGLADMTVLGAITASRVRDEIVRAGRDDLVFMDANLEPATIGAIAAARPAGLAAGPVSQQKVTRLRPALPSIDYLFLNRYEAAVLADRQVTGDAGELAKVLAAGTARSGLVTAGREAGAAWGSGMTVTIAAPPARPVNVNGAGDALAAATLARLWHGDDFFQAARIGMAAAALTIEVPATVRHDLTMELLMSRYKETVTA
jgi:pseudouridine kinase